MRPALSISQAAKLTGDDPGNWGHIERGYQALPGGRRRIIMNPPAPVLARMSAVVGVTPAQWVKRGRRDVAQRLRVILRDRRREADAVSAALARADDAFVRVIRSRAGLSEDRRVEYVQMWHQGGREKVIAVVERILRQLSED